ncbi:uncharacterized protein PAC_04814 [Phialocephala subalpina]|uniref:Uncharacterized protein n=1 Tax=Phialocephala subalpina TaxID=576137 RepID=A0A1L7WQ78_9HELO|nr:uncharacterized protein PAC_04814 [Phialocephala subalpina]
MLQLIDAASARFLLRKQDSVQRLDNIRLEERILIPELQTDRGCRSSNLAAFTSVGRVSADCSGSTNWATHAIQWLTMSTHVQICVGADDIASHSRLNRLLCENTTQTKTNPYVAIMIPNYNRAILTKNASSSHRPSKSIMQALIAKVLIAALAAVPSASALGEVEFFQNNACSLNEVDSNTGAGCSNIDVGLPFLSFAVTDNEAASVEVQLFSDTNCQVPCQNFTVPGISPCEPITGCGTGAVSFIGTEL